VSEGFSSLVKVERSKSKYTLRFSK